MQPNSALLSHTQYRVLLSSSDETRVWASVLEKRDVSCSLSSLAPNAPLRNAAYGYTQIRDKDRMRGKRENLQTVRDTSLIFQ